MEEKKYSILIVEDELLIRKNYVSVLKKTYDIFEAGSAEEAYSLYEKHKPDILLVDIQLPKQNGLFLIERIRKQDLNTKIIVLSGSSDEKYLLSANSLKLNAYLLKPISRKTLNEVLKKAKEEIYKFTINHNCVLFLQDDYIWNYKEKSLYLKNNLVSLTIKEKEVFNLLVQNKSQVISYEVLLNEIWYDIENYELSAIKTMVKKLRRKLPEGLIENVYGQGYRLLV